MAICEKASWSRPVGRSSHGLQRKEGWDIHTRCGRSTNTKLLALSTQQSTVAIPIRHSLHVQFLQRPVISPHLQSAIPVSKPLLFFPESKPWQFSETLHQHQSKDRNMRRKSISRASLSSEGRANKDSENPSQDANRLGDKTDNQLIGGSPEFASDSTSMSNFQLPKIAMVDEGSIGSSRFDVAVRALKGDFDPPTPSEVCQPSWHCSGYWTYSTISEVRCLLLPQESCELKCQMLSTVHV